MNAKVLPQCHIYVCILYNIESIFITFTNLKLSRMDKNSQNVDIRKYLESFKEELWYYGNYGIILP